MKTMKKMSLLFMTIALMGIVMVLGGCGTDDNGGSGELTYSVTVKDALGNPYNSGIVVQFLQDGAQVAMQACDENGVASKTMEKGNYEAALIYADGEDAYYYEGDLSLSADRTEAEVVLSYKVTSEAQVLNAGTESYDAYAIRQGCNYVELGSEKRNFFLFTPEEAGSYEVSVVGADEVSIGYYGSQHYLREESAVEVVDNKFTVSVETGMIGSGEGGTSILAFGIDVLNADVKNCILAVERVADAAYSLAQEAWTIYQPTHKPAAYTLPSGSEMKEFDITASSDTYNLVYNEEDGFYHLDSATGPLVLVHLTKNPQYMDCFGTIIEHTGVKKYFYDENGEYEKKEDYTECLISYVACADEKSGLYPLTEDLKYIIQQAGDHNGWWSADKASYLFVDDSGAVIPGVNSDISWLFMCCYVE